MACVRCLVLHPSIHFLCPEQLLAIGKRTAHPLTDHVRIFALKCEDVSQEGFNALVHCSPGCRAREGANYTARHSTKTLFKIGQRSVRGRSLLVGGERTERSGHRCASSTTGSD